MDWAALTKLLGERLQQPSLYLLVLGVGLLINLYGQIIVPWLRGAHPLEAMTKEARQRPGLFTMSVIVAFFFPFLVSVGSSVGTSYATRHVYERANFPDEKPDPVFRVDLRGQFVDMGRSTRDLIAEHPADDARGILGASVWKSVSKAHRGGRRLEDDTIVRYGGECYLVTQSSSSDGKLVNIYLARIASHSGAACKYEEGLKH